MPTRAAFIAIALTLFATTRAMAQQAPPMEISAGYLALTAGSDGYPKGYFLDLAVNVTSRFGVTFATDGAFRNESFEYLVLGGRRVQGEGTVILERVPLTIKTMTRGLMVGGRVMWPDPRVIPYVEGAAGAAHLSAHAETGTSTEAAASLRDAYRSSEWRTAVQAGVGVDIVFSSRNAVRLGIEYRQVERVPGGFIESEDRGRGPNQLLVAIGYARMIGK